ncbi:hypothetical protein DPEC_G00045750 [Dallia pectoralis]|uniref:Uncharacterized protein n=1 Tax=Dallia pectoralis TaxID=75939 RepID=A0ACC2HB02_DALPE|nr:hypothetical protein DPEC_G00045750 [Dallia pectoralis]
MVGLRLNLDFDLRHYSAVGHVEGTFLGNRLLIDPEMFLLALPPSETPVNGQRLHPVSAMFVESDFTVCSHIVRLYPGTRSIAGFAADHLEWFSAGHCTAERNVTHADRQCSPQSRPPDVLSQSARHKERRVIVLPAENKKPPFIDKSGPEPRTSSAHLIRLVPAPSPRDVSRLSEWEMCERKKEAGLRAGEKQKAQEWTMLTLSFGSCATVESSMGGGGGGLFSGERESPHTSFLPPPNGL